ncbi:MAG: DNA-3-methyladenine glycosylase 2 family protein [Candidatus Pacebacteria bacterium]|nr:DNA-3-methyladenine glycosylase 2 family protein [Candidatus Paceibacterota bacterium]
MEQPDYKDALRALKKDPKFATLLKRHGKPDLSRYHGGINIFQSLLRSIVFQQISGSAARAIHGRLLELFSKQHPTPAALIKIPAPQLRACGLSVQKIVYVRDLAERCLDGTIEEKRFPGMTSEEIVDHLIVVKGIGVWTAQMMLIFRLHRLDILPVGDLAIRKGFKKVYKLRNDPKPKDMERIAKPWRAYASVASWYLWEEVDETKRAAK